MYVYYVTSPLLRGVKVGRWTGSVKVLRQRYQTYYGKDLDLGVFQCSKNRAIEKAMHRHLEAYKLDGEVFDERSVPAIQRIAAALCEPHVDLVTHVSSESNWAPRSSQVKVQDWMISHGYLTLPKDHAAALVSGVTKGRDIVLSRAVSGKKRTFYECTLGAHGSQAALFGLTAFFKDSGVQQCDILVLERIAHGVLDVRIEKYKYEL